jgi:hypothetical protein
MVRMGPWGPALPAVACRSLSEHVGDAQADSDDERPHRRHNNEEEEEEDVQVRAAARYQASMAAIFRFKDWFKQSGGVEDVAAEAARCLVHLRSRPGTVPSHGFALRSNPPRRRMASNAPGVSVAAARERSVRFAAWRWRQLMAPEACGGWRMDEIGRRFGGDALLRSAAAMPAGAGAAAVPAPCVTGVAVVPPAAAHVGARATAQGAGRRQPPRRRTDRRPRAAHHSDVAGTQPTVAGAGAAGAGGPVAGGEQSRHQ